METFRRQLDSLRVDHGMSMRELARRAHVDPSHLARVARGDRAPTVELARAVDAALGADGQLISLVSSRRDDEELRASSRESVSLSRLLAGSPASATVTGLWAGTEQAAIHYLNHPPRAMLREAANLRRQALDALRSRRIVRPADVREVTRTLGYLSGILAYAALDLGNPAAATSHATLAWDVAEAVGDKQLQAWVRGTQSLVARFTGDFPSALALAEDGLRHRAAGTATIRLWCGVAQSNANLGARDGTWAALDRAARARERQAGDDPLSGLFGFSEAKQAYYGASSLIWLDRPSDAFRADAEAGRAIDLWAAASLADRSLDDEALAQVYAATARLQVGRLEEAVAALEPTLGLSEDRRISWIRKRLSRVAALLGGRRFATDPLSAETRERIAAYQ